MAKKNLNSSGKDQRLNYFFPQKVQLNVRNYLPADKVWFGWLFKQDIQSSELFS